jgi:1-acyl-sn-glycerol-3-phosphate acyltransferase
MNYAHLYEDKRLNLILGAIKFFLFLKILVIFMIHHSIVDFLITEKKRRLNFYIKSISSYSKLALNLLCIKIEKNSQNSHLKSSVIVANHQSYIDILILAAHYPSLFISSVEVKETPILGLLCELAGCSFVERRKSRQSETTKAQELFEVSQRLQEGANITFFPEATTTNGDTVLPFKSTFFQTAIDTQSPVLPIVIKYNDKAKFVVPWYGEMTFLDHLFKLCQLNEITVTLKVLDPIWKNDRFQLAEKAHKNIALNFY